MTIVEEDGLTRFVFCGFWKLFAGNFEDLLPGWTEHSTAKVLLLQNS